jgi:hypothetical protein
VAERPTVEELVVAVREWLDGELRPSLEGRAAFHARVAVNALGMVERELQRGEELDVEVGRVLAALLEHDGSREELERELAAAIREGRLDGGTDPSVLDAVRASVRAKLSVADPRRVT